MSDDRGELDLTRVIDNYEKLLKDADAKMIKKLEEIEMLKSKVFNAENETALIKATGMNSPEMREIRKELSEVKSDNKKLAIQVNELVDRLRDSNF